MPSSELAGPVTRHMKARCQVVSVEDPKPAEWLPGAADPSDCRAHTLPTASAPACIGSAHYCAPALYSCLDTLAATYRLGANAKATVVSVRSPVCDCDGLWRSRNAVASTRPSHALELVYTHF